MLSICSAFWTSFGLAGRICRSVCMRCTQRTVAASSSMPLSLTWFLSFGCYSSHSQLAAILLAAAAVVYSQIRLSLVKYSLSDAALACGMRYFLSWLRLFPHTFVHGSRGQKAEAEAVAWRTHVTAYIDTLARARFLFTNTCMRPPTHVWLTPPNNVHHKYTRMYTCTSRMRRVHRQAPTHIHNE